MQLGAPPRASIVLAVSILAGALLGLIGLRYLIVPESAARTFGVAARPAGHELHYIIGLRNLWLGALAMGLAALRQWHGLALWFAMAVPVCFADALIAATATGKAPQVAFHLLCGVACALLAGACWRSRNGGP
jgi:Domain of unknown function (DUF4267)